jgi:hypothetical protein
MTMLNTRRTTNAGGGNASNVDRSPIPTYSNSEVPGNSTDDLPF